MKRSTAAGSSRGVKPTSKGVRGKPYHFPTRAPGHRARGGGASVPALFQRDGLGAAGHLERQLQRVFVGLGAAVDPEHGLEAETRELRQPRRGALANRHGQRIGLERHLARLALERGQPARMAVAQAGDRMAAVEIQDLAAVARMQPDAFAVHHLDRILREHLAPDGS